MQHHPFFEHSVVSGPVVPRHCPNGLPGLIRDVAISRPMAIAASDDVCDLTYQELEVWSDTVARALRAAAPPEVPVIVAFPRSIELVVALLAILKAGLPYLTVDPASPHQQVHRIVQEAGSTLALVGQHVRQVTATQGLSTIEIDALRPVTTNTDLDQLPAVQAAQAVYALFTPGPTGALHGVLLPSQALCNRLLWMRETYGAGAEDRILQASSITCEASTWELWLPLISGGTCVFLTPEAHPSPATVTRVIIERQITMCCFMPPMLAEFLSRPEAAQCSSLRHVFYRGGTLSAAASHRFASTLWARLHGLSGVAEAAGDITHWSHPDLADTVDPLSPASVALAPVSRARPIDNCVMAVLGANGLPVPLGQEGELHIGGLPLALGYLHRPDLTTEAFVNGVSGSPAPRWYRTGDRVRLLNGELEYLGRINDSSTSPTEERVVRTQLV
ncbi:AMP-binding protein [Kineosporia sp. NBRC 101731]|uniref:AMP-binding protein n=1 Tax=Kineosporia sp. NBRC 101731 TaxID=3032199 RepID=UPI0024A0B626|nr:AMP-binding protein [Kineosporia sp. NBRC 101731]GLY32191.1 hypothetical protein Kisp02_55560 [Kineosporia sp. NBRC 101731]